MFLCNRIGEMNMTSGSSESGEYLRSEKTG